MGVRGRSLTATRVGVTEVQGVVSTGVAWCAGAETAIVRTVSGGVSNRRLRLPVEFQFLPHNLSAASSCNGVGWSFFASSVCIVCGRASLAISIWVIVRAGLWGFWVVVSALAAAALGAASGVGGISSSQCSAARESILNVAGCARAVASSCAARLCTAPAFSGGVCAAALLDWAVSGTAALALGSVTGVGGVSSSRWSVVRRLEVLCAAPRSCLIVRGGRAGITGLGLLVCRGLRKWLEAGATSAGAVVRTTSWASVLECISGYVALCFATLVSRSNLDASLS